MDQFYFNQEFVPEPSTLAICALSAMCISAGKRRLNLADRRRP
jgi:hypothetical protein